MSNADSWLIIVLLLCVNRAHGRAHEQQSAELVHAMLPPSIVPQAMRDGMLDARLGAMRTILQPFVAATSVSAVAQLHVAILTTDIIGFTSLSAAIGAQEVVQMLDMLYFSFDHLVTRTKCYKVETIGDGMPR